MGGKFIVMLLAAALPAAASAEGALALGIPPDISASGAAIGWSINKPDGRRAMDSAMEECLRTPQVAPQVRAMCKPVRSFHRECIAIAIDPQAGTAGFGWALFPTAAAAERQALDACIASDGDRGNNCKFTVSKGDANDEARLPDRGYTVPAAPESPRPATPPPAP